MRVALVHDWLNTKVGGAERVLLELADIYPDADIYTLLFDAGNFQGRLDPTRVKTSWLQKLPAPLRRRSRYLLPWLPSAIESFDLSGYDVVISSSGAFSKGVITRPETLHVCYCHSPMRFVWDYWPAYIEEQAVGRWRRAAIHLLVSRLRLWDYYSASRPDIWVANSQTVAKRISKYYGKTSSVVYPPVDTGRFTPASETGDYYVTVAALTPYKRLDVAIEAFNQSGRRLVVIGDGADRSRLERMAADNIKFMGRIGDEALAEKVAQAKGLVFPNEEDFGIAPVEAMAAGTPVIAYAKGGVTETVIDGKTGVLFDRQTGPALNQAIERLEQLDLDKEVLRRRAQEFDRRIFRGRLQQLVKDAAQKQPASAAAVPRSFRFLGVRIDDVTVWEAMQYIHNLLARTDASAEQIVTVNPEFVMLSQENQRFRQVIEGALLSVPDGAGALVIGRLTGRPLRQRVAGADLVEHIALAAARQGWRIFMLGAGEGVAEQAAAVLSKRYPGLKVAGTYAGSPAPGEADSIIEKINASEADILFVAYGAPSQDLWIDTHLDKLDVKLAMGIGGTFDFIAGRVRRAPRVLQRAGLEWLWRLALQPWRWRRMLLLPRFAWLSLLEKRRRR